MKWFLLGVLLIAAVLVTCTLAFPQNSDDWYVIKNHGDEYIAVHGPSARKSGDLLFVWMDMKPKKQTWHMKVQWVAECTGTKHKILSIVGSSTGKTLAGPSQGWEEIVPDSVMDIVRNAMCPVFEKHGDQPPPSSWQKNGSTM